MAANIKSLLRSKIVCKSKNQRTTVKMLRKKKTNYKNLAMSHNYNHQNCLFVWTPEWTEQLVDCIVWSVRKRERERVMDVIPNLSIYFHDGGELELFKCTFNFLNCYIKRNIFWKNPEKSISMTMTIFLDVYRCM